MQVFVNNKEVDTQATTLSTLIEQLGMPAQGVAAAVDNKWCHAHNGLIFHSQPVLKSPLSKLLVADKYTSAGKLIPRSCWDIVTHHIPPIL